MTENKAKAAILAAGLSASKAAKIVDANDR
jgi:hypothetical protein